ncbi:YybH family protein [Jiulongibacter sp. NS-SX5]|uniref:YybH family protein n=1 Tax=Jiulongibacter sp. NS-SX5 TaxID=3463854 RepID=UPI004058BDF2
MKKKFIRSILSVILLSVSGAAAIAQSKAEQGILENFKAQETCWNAHDLECYVNAAYEDNPKTMTIGRSGVTYGVDQILANYKKYYNDDNMGQLHFDQITMQKVSNKVYFVTGRFNLEYEDIQETRRGYFSGLAKKIKGKWLLVTDHSS